MRHAAISALLLISSSADAESIMELSADGQERIINMSALPDTTLDTWQSGSEGSLETVIDIALETVLGPDGRTQINSSIATEYPLRTIGRVDIGCTGTMINKKFYLTAGHCVFNATKKTWNQNLNFSAAQSDNAKKPYNTVAWDKAWTSTEYMKSADINFDWALVRLKTELGTQTGWMGIRVDPSLAAGTSINIDGYPGDKTFGTFWHMYCQIRAVNATRMWHDCDTFGGNSGSAMYRYYSAKKEAFIDGIHAYGVGAGSDSFNSGTRITQSIFNTLTSLMTQNP